LRQPADRCYVGPGTAAWALTVAPIAGDATEALL